MEDGYYPDYLAEGESGGSIPGAPGAAAFTLHRGAARVPVLIAVPHAGRLYPPDLAAQLRAPAEAAHRLEDRLVDLLAAEVARRTGAWLLVAHAPRAMIDLNRAADDVDWAMVVGNGESAEALRGAAEGAGRRARSGLGLVPRRLAGLGELWRQRLPLAELAARIDQVHRPYHQALAAALHDLRDQWGEALLLDLHSMPPLGPRHGALAAADFVLGDRFGAACAPALAQSALAELEWQRRRVAHNRPYAGGHVLDRHGVPARGLHALQVEVCRGAYLDSRLRQPGPGFAGVAQVLTALVQRLAGELAGRGRGLPLAAE